MRRAQHALRAVLLLGSQCLGCSEQPYVIGRYPDAGVDAALSECAASYAGALACSDFESSMLDAGWDETVIENQGELEHSTLRSHSGESSLRAASLDAMSVAVVSRELEPVRDGELHLRAYLYVAASLPTDTINVFFIGASPQPDPFTGIDVNLKDGVLQVFSPQADPVRQMGTLQIPRDQWFCLRARIPLSDEAGVVELFANDQLALRATQIDTLPDAGVTQLRAGVDWSSEQSAFFELFIDDLVLDRAPVPCFTE
jgi:hypothetical protein